MAERSSLSNSNLWMNSSPQIQTYHFSPTEEVTLSILIPTWNNIAYLQNCVQSIRDHSESKLEILVFVNEDSDLSSDWLRKERISHMVCKQNVGICIAMNQLRTLASGHTLCYLNDDMFVLPEWDSKVLAQIENIDGDYFLSSTMIEPTDTGNPCVIVAEHGNDLDSFQKEILLKSHNQYSKDDWSGSSWPPLFMRAQLWDKIEGFSEEYSPGMYSDPDMAMKAWQTGCRIYSGIGESRVYHFGSRSTKRLKKSAGKTIFLKKWGVTSRYFYKNYLKMGEKSVEKLPDFEQGIIDKWIHKAKLWKSQYSDK